MERLMQRQWNILLLEGIVVALFGLALLFLPGLTVRVLVYVLGAYAFVDGVFSAVGAVMNREVDDSWLLWLALGIISALFGLVIIFWPAISALFLLWMIAARALTLGILEIAGAFRMRSGSNVWWLLIFSGGFSVLFGLLAFFWPGGTALVLLWLIAVYLLVVGILRIVLAIVARSMLAQQA
jgi:uncharacterized membrane protein HdeD (DUF308 family)